MDLVSNSGSATYKWGDLDTCSPSPSPGFLAFRTGAVTPTTQGVKWENLCTGPGRQEARGPRDPPHSQIMNHAGA